ncbi:MAG: hypothetical protein LBC72_05505 [Spirochaetaceae bacterium]|jgi:hypothetical protein|nr:hypothetical protein [Spirochaetaceae bacterium]
MKRNAFFAGVLGAALVVSGCHNNPTDDAPPARQENIVGVEVTYGRDVLPVYDADAIDGGWFEKADAPENAKTYTPPADAEAGTDGYTLIDPKREFTVTLVSAQGQDSQAPVGDFQVIVEYKENGVYVAREDSRLSNLGEARLVVKYTKRPDMTVHYRWPGAAATTTDPFEILVVQRAAPNGADFKGYTVRRAPFKKTYDWQEPLDPSGLEVVRWYGGGTSFEAGGTPVQATVADYLMDSFNYSKLFVDETTGAPLAAPPNSQTATIWIKKPSDTPVLDGNADAAGAYTCASFDITLQVVERTIIGGENISGEGFLSEANSKKMPTDSGVLTLIGQSSNILNPESVKVLYGDMEVTPLPPLGAGTDVRTNALNLRWHTDTWATDAVKPEGNNGQWKMTFGSMPMADLIVKAEFIKASNRLQKICVATSKAETEIFGFNPNINFYTYVVQNSDDAVWITGRTSGGAPLAPGAYFTEATTTSTDDDYYKVADLPEGDTVVTIDPDGSGKLYTIVIKRMTQDGSVDFGWADGLVQTFYPPVAGTYKFEAWGAFGGEAPNYEGHGGDGRGGWGGYSAGKIVMDPGRSTQWDPNDVANTGGGAGNHLKAAYIYVGEGGYTRSGQTAGKATWNGGGAGGMGGAYGAGSGGGGATSVSLTRGAWSDSQVLNDRIMVAGGGGGYGHNNGRTGNAAGFAGQGGHVGSNWSGNLNDANPATGYLGTSVSGGWWMGATQRPGSGRGGQGFGVGGKGPQPPGYGSYGAEGRGGGGGGYFGGEVVWSPPATESNSGGGGGSGYVSGYNTGTESCISYNPVSREGWMVPKGAEKPGTVSPAWSAVNIEDHYSGYEFTEGLMNKLNATNNGTKGAGAYASGTWQAHPQNPNNNMNGLVALGKKNLDGYFRVTLLPANP